MEPEIVQAVAAAGRKAHTARVIGSGASGSVVRVETDQGAVVVKVSRSADLRAEGRSLAYLRTHSSLPVPEVYYASERALVMEAMPGQTGAGRAERHAAELLAGLHDVQGEAFGLEFDNLIGPLPQPNTRSRSWVTFFRERRLMTMVEAAAREGAIPETLAAGLERLAGKLESLIPDQPRASLVHGDVWSGNVLHEEERITALLDPAPYYAHAEVELAFITLFSTFGTGFFRAYAERRPIDPEFWSTRRDLYNLYPLLVHARLFGGTYVGQLASTAARFL